MLLISGLSLVGYVAVRLLGPNRGIPLTGLTGGLVSSTAVTLSFARQSREKGHARSAPAFACGILIAWGVMFLRVLATVLIVNRALLPRLVVPFLAMAAVTAGLAWVMYRRAADDGSAGSGVPLSNPFSLTSAAKFAALFALVLLLVAFVQQNFPPEGVYVVAALAGTTDVDAITLSMSEYARRGDVDCRGDGDRHRGAHQHGGQGADGSGTRCAGAASPDPDWRRRHRAGRPRGSAARLSVERGGAHEFIAT